MVWPKSFSSSEWVQIKTETIVSLQLGQPRGLGRVRGHAPVPARREADRADLGAVGGHGALVLLIEEPAHEQAQPAAQGSFVVRAGESVTGEEERLPRSRAQAQQAV